MFGCSLFFCVVYKITFVSFLIINYCLLWCVPGWLVDGVRMCYCGNQCPGTVGFIGLFLMLRNPNEISTCSGSVFGFFEYDSQLLDCHCFLWAAGVTRIVTQPRQQRQMSASCWLLSNWTQRLFLSSLLQQSWRRSHFSAQCDITCLNYYHRGIHM